MRSARQSAKALSKQRSKTELQEKVTNILQNSKIIEKAIDKWYNKVRKERKVLKMKQKEYKFVAHITHKDMTTEDNMFIDYTTSARCRAKKVAERPDVESVHLYRIDKTEIFA